MTFQQTVEVLNISRRILQFQQLKYRATALSKPKNDGFRQELTVSSLTSVVKEKSDLHYQS